MVDYIFAYKEKQEQILRKQKREEEEARKKTSKPRLIIYWKGEPWKIWISLAGVFLAYLARLSS